jgi:hypothetical protein
LRLDRTAFDADNRRATSHCKGLQMRNVLALVTAAVLAAILPLPGIAQAQERWPDVPPEIGVFQVGRAGWVPYRCSDAPVYNFYHEAYYREPPAVYRGYAYRPYYRYAAWRVIPRTYFCSQR